MSEQKFFKTPFALEGDRQEIPDALQPTGVVSFTTGYGFDYERDPETDPNAKDIERGAMNWLFGVMTEVLGQYQKYGTFFYITPEQNGGTSFPYARRARCLYDDGEGLDVYESLADNNTALPTDAAKWSKVSISSLVPNTRQIKTTGSLSGGGTLDQDLTLSVDVPPSVPPARKINTTAPLSGGGALDADLTLRLNASAAATANYLVQRDAKGRAKVAAPAASDDIARKAEVDAVAARKITVSSPLSGGGDLTRDMTLGLGVVGKANGGTGNTTGQAASALKLATARTISLTGGAAGSATFDGSANVALDVTSLDFSKGTGTVPVAKGGTGATTAANARKNLGIVLNNTVTSTSATEFATPNAVKTAYDKAVAAANAASSAQTASGAKAPMPQGGAGVGQWVYQPGNTLPPGGVWAYIVGLTTNGGLWRPDLYTYFNAGVAAGGSVIITSQAGYVGFVCWRLA